MKVSRFVSTLIAYICTLSSYMCLVYALGSDGRIVHMGWQPLRRTLSPVRPIRGLSPLDPTSYSRPELAIITHISLSLNVDFKKQVLCGKVTLNFYVLEDIDELPLDMNCLKIESITLGPDMELQYEIVTDAPDKHEPSKLTLGSKLNVKLPKTAASGDKLKITIQYTTDPIASGLTWLKPSQTSGKKYPYMFSQCSPIHARSIMPCQDSPTVRFTYDAEVTAPVNLTVLMSALKGKVKNNKSMFNQPVPIPASVFAIAVGALECRTVGPRSKVWAEKENLELSASEFSDVEKYLQAAEKLCGSYDWTVYDILVMPPSFPHGAMENPCLTFINPTAVVGDKSLTGVVIHEIMHSWTGNAVSIKNFDHFWLNEGFAVYLQRKVIASLINDTTKAWRTRDLIALSGLLELTETIDAMGATNQFTKLVLNLDGVHPADAFSRIPYQKGALFLRYLEEVSGGPRVFDRFIRSYIRTFSMQSLDTDQFKAFCLKYFKRNDKIKAVDWDTWLHDTGMPPILPTYDVTLVKPMLALAAKMEKSNYTFSSNDVKDLNVGQMIYLLQYLIQSTPMPLDKLKCMGEAYGIAESKNKEIKYRWLRLCIRSRDESKLNEVLTFVNEHGRLSYVRPLYKELYDWEDVRDVAINNFLRHEKYMSHITAYNVRKDLHLND